jgi:putative transposase
MYDGFAEIGIRSYIVRTDTTTPPSQVNYVHVPDDLWAIVADLLPRPRSQPRPGRPRAHDRAALNGSWYILCTGCEWKAIQHDCFGVSSSVPHERFPTWQALGIFAAMQQIMIQYYQTGHGMGWTWQAIDSKSCPTPLGGEQTGQNPTDRGKQGSKMYALVYHHGAPLAVHSTAANEHDTSSDDDLLLSIVVSRSDPDTLLQHVCADKGTWAELRPEPRTRRSKWLKDPCVLPTLRPRT